MPLVDRHMTKRETQQQTYTNNDIVAPFESCLYKYVTFIIKISVTFNPPSFHFSDQIQIFFSSEFNRMFQGRGIVSTCPDSCILTQHITDDS